MIIFNSYFHQLLKIISFLALNARKNPTWQIHMSCFVKDILIYNDIKIEKTPENTLI